MDNYADGFFNLFERGVGAALDIERDRATGNLERKRIAAENEIYTRGDSGIVRSGTSSNPFGGAPGGFPVAWLIGGAIALFVFVLLLRK